MTDPVSLYPALAQVAPTLESLGQTVGPMTVPAGTVLFDENSPCRGFPLVLEGEVKVSRHSGDGRSLELYRVIPGELCLVSSACLFRSTPLSAQGITTRPTTLLLIPPPIFNQWIATPAFRDNVLGLFAERMADLTGLIDAVAFHKLDQRLAALGLQCLAQACLGKQAGDRLARALAQQGGFVQLFGHCHAGRARQRRHGWCRRTCVHAGGG